MLYQDMRVVRQHMNEAASAGEPFLFAVNFEGSEAIFIRNPLSRHELFFTTPAGGNKSGAAAYAADCTPDSAFLEARPLLPEAYKKKFDVVHKALLRGDTYLANLTVRTPVRCGLTLRDIFLRSTSPYQLYVPGRFVCFSPERFVKITAEGLISTNPMKGTIDAALTDAEATLLADVKEAEEHNTIVDLLRNDLSMWATGVSVRRFRYVERIRAKGRELLQASSEIVGQLPADFRNHMGDILFDMLPAGSCTGAPKKSTVDVIRRAEGEPRGYYTGVFGFFDGKELDSAVLIRFMEAEGGELFFRSGGGITAQSDWEGEYRETLQKIYLPFA